MNNKDLPHICSFLTPQYEPYYEGSRFSWTFGSKSLIISRANNFGNFNYHLEFDSPIEGNLTTDGVVEDQSHFAKLFKWLLKKKAVDV